MGTRDKESPKYTKIIETAITLFIQFSSKRVSVEEICRKAQVSKMTFYKYFKNKSELIKDISNKWIEETFKAFDKINSQDIPFPEKIDKMTRWRTDFKSRINPDFIYELSAHDDIKKRIKIGYIDNIINAQIKGEIRHDINPEFYWMIVEKVGELYDDDSWKKVFTNLDDFQNQIRTLFFYGLLVRDNGESTGKN